MLRGLCKTVVLPNLYIFAISKSSCIVYIYTPVLESIRGWYFPMLRDWFFKGLVELFKALFLTNFGVLWEIACYFAER